MKTKTLIILITLVFLVGGFFIYINFTAPKEIKKSDQEITGPEEERELPEALEETFKKEPAKEFQSEEVSPEEPVEVLDDTIRGDEELSTETQPEPEESILSVPEFLAWQKETGIRVLGGVSSHTIFKDNQYWMYYTAIGGIRLARAVDGLSFQEYGAVLTNGPFGSEQETATNPTVFRLKNGQYRMIYEGSQNQQTIRKLFSAVSSNGLTWTKEEGVRLSDSIFFYDPQKGTGGDVVFTSVPDVIEMENDCFRMYYTVIDESRIAESCDEGLTWQKKGKIIFDVYVEIVQDPDIIQLDEGGYKLFFSTQNLQRTSQWILSAFSEDGINFKIDSGKRIEPASGKARAVDPDIVKLPDGNYRMYYGESSTFGGDFNLLSAISKD